MFAALTFTTHEKMAHDKNETQLPTQDPAYIEESITRRKLLSKWRSRAAELCGILYMAYLTAGALVTRGYIDWVTTGT